jgi:hypothetical protein
LLVIAITMVVQVRTVAASCVEEATMLREHLQAESKRVWRWNTLWAVGFGGAAVGQAVLIATETNPTGTFDRDFEEQMYVGTAKATLAVAARLVLPLRLAIPAKVGDPCTDAAALRAAVIKAGTREKRTVLLTLIGGTVINLAGAIVLMQRRNLKTGALSFATGVPFGPLSAITQPRKSWRMRDEREAEWTIGIGGVAGEPASLWLAGEF